MPRDLLIYHKTSFGKWLKDLYLDMIILCIWEYKLEKDDKSIENHVKTSFRYEIRFKLLIIVCVQIL